MRKILATLLTLALMLSCVSALAEYPEYINLEGDYPVVKEGYDAPELSLFVTRHSTYGVDADKMWIYAYFKNALGMNLNVTQILDTGKLEQKNLIMASGDMPDMMVDFTFTTAELMKYGSEGLLLDMAPYITPELTPNIYGFFEAYPEVRKGVTTPNGAIYTLPKISTAHADHQPTCYFINTTWAEKTGYAELPTDLDGMIEMLRAFKAQDPGETGGKVVPLGGFYSEKNPGYLVLNALGYVGKDASPIIPMLREGKAAVCAADKEMLLEYVKIMKQLYDEGLIAKDFFTGDITQFKAEATEQLYGAYFDVPFYYLAEQPQWVQYHAGYPLTSQHNDKLQWQDTIALRSIGNFVASAETQSPELLMRFADWSFSNDNYKATQGPMAVSDADVLYGMTGGTWLSTDGSGLYGRVDYRDGTYGSDLEALYAHVRWHNMSFGKQPPFVNFKMDYTYMFIKEQGVYIDDKKVRFPEVADHYQRLTQQEAYWPYSAAGFPEFLYWDEDTTQRINDLRVLLTEYWDTEFAKFVTGARAMEDFDAFYEQMEKLGVAEYFQYYADAYEQYSAS